MKRKKVIKKKSQAIKLPKIYTIAFTMALISALVWLASALFLRSYNINLSIQQQEIEQKISNITVINDALRVEIQELMNRERVTQIAEDSGMVQNQNSVVTLDDE